jgi:chaperonin GroES
MNSSGIMPVEYNVLVKPREVEEQTKGGLLIPDQMKEREQFAQQEGTLVAVSPGAFGFNYPEWPTDARKPQAGDAVLFAKYQATEVRGRDGVTYWMMKDGAIAALMEEAQ